MDPLDNPTFSTYKSAKRPSAASAALSSQVQMSSSNSPNHITKNMITESDGTLVASATQLKNVGESYRLCYLKIKTRSSKILVKYDVLFMFFTWPVSHHTLRMYTYYLSCQLESLYEKDLKSVFIDSPNELQNALG